MNETIKDLGILIIIMLLSLSLGFSLCKLNNSDKNIASYVEANEELVYHKSNTTGSMKPFIVNDVYITYEKVTNKTELKVGDVIIYAKNGNETKLIQHRIVFIGENYYITKGDNNIYPDTWLVKRNEIKKVLTSIRYKKRAE